MKPKILILSLIGFFISITFSSNAQNTFELLIEDKLDQMPTSVIETDEYYVFSEIFGVISHPGTKTNLYKTNKQGHILQIKTIKPEVYEFVLSNIIYEENGKFTGFGFQKVAEDSAAVFTILEMNSEFSVLTEKKYRTNFYRLSYITVEQYKNGYLIIGSGNLTPLPDYHLFSYMVNSTYDTLKSRVYQEEGTIFAFDILLTLDKSFAKIFTRGFVQQTGTGGQIILMDSCLNRISYTPIPEVVFSYMDAKYIDDSHYLLSGKRDIFDEDRQGSKLALMLMDTADIMQDIQLLGPADTINYPGFYSNLDFMDVNEIYYGGIKNLPFGYFTQADSWFFLNKFNSNLELQWQKFYGGDANFNLWEMIATQDGGCLMAGTRYDYLTQTNLRDIYILKVNEDGLIVGTGEEPIGITVQDAIVYPNPGSEFLKVQSGPQVNGALFELLNLSGNLVIVTTLNQRMETINTSDIPSGTYPYRVTYQNKIVASGKWVKQ